MYKLTLRVFVAGSLAALSASGCDDQPLPSDEDVPAQVSAPPALEPTRQLPPPEPALHANADAAPPATNMVGAAPSTPKPAPVDVAPLVDAGTPLSSAEQLAGLRDSELTCYPLLAHAGDERAPYPVGVATDAYVAFTFAAPWRETSHAVLFRPVLDNKRVLHHWLLFQDNTRGTPSGGVVQSGAHPDAQLIAAWTPGTDPLDFRKTGADVGLELPADTTYMLEIHYNSDDAAAVDRSGVEVCTHPRTPAHSAGYSWLGYENFLLPSATWSGTCKPNMTDPIHVLAIVPHMHLKGVHMKATLNRADGSHQVFHDQPYDFDYERQYLVNLTLQPGDSITTECTYSEPMVYGPGVHDEMCYMFTVAYPRGALTSPDLIGGIFHGGTSCFGQ